METLIDTHANGAATPAGAAAAPIGAGRVRMRRGPHARTRQDPLGLTPRERQIFGLLLLGLSNAAIAARLHRSERTVENHVAAVLDKTGSPNRVELARRHATAD